MIQTFKLFDLAELNYQSYTISGFKDMEISKSEFGTRTKFLKQT